MLKEIVNKPKTRNANLDFCRSIACLAVVLTHVIYPFWNNTPVVLMPINEYAMNASGGLLQSDTYGWMICSIIDAICRFSVPVFVIISGALILNKDRLNLKYICNKIIKFALIIVCWGIVYAGIDCVLNLCDEKSIAWKSVIKTIVRGPAAFWYFFMLIPLYIISPVLRQIILNKKAAEWYLVCWFMLTVIPQSIKVWMPDLNGNVYAEYISAFSCYSGFFVYGGYHLRYGKSPVNSYLLMVLSTISLLIMACGKPVNYFHNFTTPFCAIYSISIVALVSRAKRMLENHKLNYIFSSFSRYTLGIYVVHMLVLNVLKRIWILDANIWWLQSIVYFIITLLISVGSTVVIKKCPVTNRIV